MAESVHRFCRGISQNLQLENGINAKNALFSANERSEVEGKGKEDEGKEEKEREIGSEVLEKV